MSALADLAVSWTRVGLLGFGGGSSMVPLMHSECVDVRAWMSEDEFLDALALGNTLPGPIAAKMSIFVGLQVAGWLGAAIAFGAVMGPSSLMMVMLASAFFRYKDLPAVQGAMRAVKPVVVGLLFWTAIDLAPAGIKDWRMGVLAAVSVVVLVMKVNPLLVMVGALGLGALFFPLILYAATPTQHFDPELPSVALGVADLDERCAARVMVDPKGFVYRVHVEGCAEPYAEATEAALWRWVIPPDDGASSFAVDVHFGTAVEVGAPSAADPLPPTDPPTVPISSLTISKKKDPDVSATMLYLSQEKGIVEVFCRLDVSVGEKGKVTDLAVHECHPDLVEPVSAAVRKWRFATDGAPRRVTIILPVRSFADTRGMGTAP